MGPQIMISSFVPLMIKELALVKENSNPKADYLICRLLNRLNLDMPGDNYVGYLPYDDGNGQFIDGVNLSATYLNEEIV